MKNSCTLKLIVKFEPVKGRSSEQTETSLSTDQLNERLKSIQRSRLLLLWHDHATLLWSGYIKVTVSVL